MDHKNQPHSIDTNPTIKFKPLLFWAVLIWIVAGFAPFLLPAIPTFGPWFSRMVSKVPVGTTGLVGDTFGLANSLFSALSSAGVAYALILQIKERERSAKAEEKSEELAMLASLVHARSTILSIKQAHLEELERIRRELFPGINNESGSLLSEWITSLITDRSGDMAELMVLAYYAEKQSRWGEIKDLYYAEMDKMEELKKSKTEK